MHVRTVRYCMHGSRKSLEAEALLACWSTNEYWRILISFPDNSCFARHQHFTRHVWRNYRMVTWSAARYGIWCCEDAVGKSVRGYQFELIWCIHDFVRLCFCMLDRITDTDRFWSIAQLHPAIEKMCHASAKMPNMACLSPCSLFACEAIYDVVWCIRGHLAWSCVMYRYICFAPFYCSFKLLYAETCMT